MGNAPLRLGFLNPGAGGQGDYRGFLDRVDPAITVHLVLTPLLRDSHDLEAVAYMAAIENLVGPAEQLRPAAPHAAMWTCTCGSFYGGHADALGQVAAIGRVLGVPVSSTSLAFLAAVRALDLRRVAVAATYPADLASRFVAFLRADGVEVVGETCLGIPSGRQVAALTPDEILALARQADCRAAEAVLVPDTAMRTHGAVALLERSLGKPVLTANQVTVWQCWRLAAPDAPPVVDPRLGALFRYRLPAVAV